MTATSSRPGGNFPTTTVHTIKLCLFQATRRPKSVEKVITTSFGTVRVKGCLGQGHADVFEAICYEREKKGGLEDGRIKILVDPFRVRQRSNQASGSTFRRIIDDLQMAIIEIITPEQYACQGHLIDHINGAVKSDGTAITRSHPFGGVRPLWTVEIGKAFCRLVAADIWVGHDPAAIARLDHGISQAVARHVITHKREPPDGWFVNTLIAAVTGEIEGRKIGGAALWHRRHELKSDKCELADLGVIIDDNDRVHYVGPMFFS